MFFEKKVNTSSKEGMAKFLANHFRYSTSTFSSGVTAYAHNIKIHNLGFTENQCVKALNILSTQGYLEEISFEFDNFRHFHNGCYSITQSGRSGGYLVLVESEYYDPGYKSTCSKCGQLNFRAVGSNDFQCGVCHTPRHNLKKPLKWVRTKSSSIDQGMSLEDYLLMDMFSLKERVNLVLSFDQACDKLRSAFIELINEFIVVEKTIMVPKTVKTLERVI